jgi:hypothetical protein
MTTADEQPVCQWCHHPTTNPTWWNGRPQCRNPHACTRRIPRTDKQEQQ